MRSLRYRQVIQSFFFVHSINLCQHVTSLLECLQINLSDMFVSLPVLPHPLKANKQDEMRWLNFCVLWLEKALVKDCVVINRLNINTIIPHHHHSQDHQVAKLQKKSAVLSSAPDDDYEAGRSNFGKNNLVTTITIMGGFQSNQDQIMGPLMTISIDKDIISLIAPVPSSHCQSCWGGGGTMGDSLAEDHLTPWLAGSTSCKKLTTQNQTALSYITLIYLHALAAYCL